jgi:hypothetical protein
MVVNKQLRKNCTRAEEVGEKSKKKRERSGRGIHYSEGLKRAASCCVWLHERRARVPANTLSRTWLH